MSMTAGSAPQQALLAWARTAPVQTLVQMFDRSVRMFGERRLLSAKHEGTYRSQTYQQVRDRVDTLSFALLALGLAPGDRVAQWSPNRPEWVITDLGTVYAGAVHVPIYPSLGMAHVARILEDSEARVLMVSDASSLAKVVAIAHRLDSLEHVVVYEDGEVHGEAGRPRVWSFGELLELGKQRAAALEDDRKRRLEDIGPATVASLVYTSGTMGEPKAAMLMHGNFTSNVTSVLPCLNIGPDDVELSFLPLCHVFERIVYYAVLASGGQIAYAESIETVPANLLEVRPTIVPSVPRLFEKIYDRVREAVAVSSPVRQRVFSWSVSVARAVLSHGQSGRRMTVALALAHRLADRLVFRRIRAQMGGRIRFFISGGAPLRLDIATFFHLAGLPVLEGYGLTETSPVITFNRPERFRLGTVGQAVPGVEVRTASEDGEVLCRGPNVMAGYFRRPEDTQGAIDAEGWFHTGDIGRLDEDGFLTITDRKKEILVMSNGKNVAPQPIETLLKTSPYIEQAIVVGDNRNFIAALVYPRYPALEAWAREEGLTARGPELAREPRAVSLVQSQVDELCRNLAQFEKVKKVVLLERAMSLEGGELTPTLKFKRRVVHEKYRDEINRLYDEAPPAG